MGQCCASVRLEDKLETVVMEYERRLGWPSTQFDVFIKQIQMHVSAGEVHIVRVPMLAYSLGIRLKGELEPGAAAIFEYIKNPEGGWIERRLAALGTLLCQGSTVSKGNYILRCYGSEKRLITRDDMVELVADCVHIALNLLPTGAQESLVADGNESMAARVGRYANLLKHSVEDLCVFLLGDAFSDGRTFILEDKYQEKLSSSNLKCICDSVLMRRLATRLAKQNRDLVADESCDSSTVQEASHSDY